MTRLYGERPNLPVPTIPRQPAVGPGEDLSTEQREAARLALLEDMTQAAVAEKVGVSLRTIERWRSKPAFKRYTRHLVTTLVEEEGQKVRAILAKSGPAAARKLAANATGSKPSSPYEVDAQRTLLDRTLGKPAAGPAGELGVRVEPDGVVTIIWHSKATPGSAQAPEEEGP